jgi:hypothetical protein
VIDKSAVNWLEPCPGSAGPFVRILRPGPGEMVECLVVSARMYGVLTHFSRGRTYPCTLAKAGECELCKRPRQWTGYLGGYQPGRACYVVIVLTQEAYNSVRPVVEEPSFCWRGKWLSVARVGGSEKSRCRATFYQPRHVGAEGIPADFDVPGALMRIWGHAPESKPRSMAERAFGVEGAPPNPS